MEPVKTCLVLHCANVGLSDMPSTAEDLLCSAQKLVEQGSAEPQRRLDQPQPACSITTRPQLLQLVALLITSYSTPATSKSLYSDVFTFCSSTIFKRLVSLSPLLFGCNGVSICSHKEIFDPRVISGLNIRKHTSPHDEGVSK